MKKLRLKKVKSSVQNPKLTFFVYLLHLLSPFYFFLSTSNAFLFLLAARISKSGIREDPSGLHSQETMTHITPAFPQALYLLPKRFRQNFAF